MYLVSRHRQIHPERLRDSAPPPGYDWCAAESSEAKTTTELR
jgi:hypothetical protein